MPNFLGIITGGLLMLFVGIAWLDAPQAKKISSQLHHEIDEAIKQVSQPADTSGKTTINKQVLPAEVQKLVDKAILQNQRSKVVEQDQLTTVIKTESDINKQLLPAEVQALVDQSKIAVEQQVVKHEENEADSPWYIFWKPFRNLQSAQGFAVRLTKQTGVKITAITNENGQHRVNFSYTNEDDKQRILLLIEEKTGLQG